MKIALSLLLTIRALAAADPPAHPDATFHAVYLGAAADFSSIAVSEKGAPPVSLPVTNATVQAQIKDKFQPGDRVTITFKDNAVRSITPETIAVSIWDRILVLGVTLAVHLAFGFVLLGGNFKKLVIGDDNRYSNSKCQMAFWFGVLAVTYLSATFLRWSASGYSGTFAGGVDLPKNLLLLSGLSVFSFGAAKGITATKQAAAAAAILAPPPDPPAPALVAVAVAEGGPAPAPAAPAAAAVISQAAAPATTPPPPLKTTAVRPQFPRDLLCDDAGNPDIGDYQMMAVTAIAIGVYVTQIFGFLGSIELLHHVTVPDVDSTILATFGLGQGAYLIKKQVGD